MRTVLGVITLLFAASSVAAAVEDVFDAAIAANAQTRATTIRPAGVKTLSRVDHDTDALLLASNDKAAVRSGSSREKVQPKAADGDAPLAEGFPDATAPGSIEVKKYPAYRGAVAQANSSTALSADVLFFTLFGHIQRNKIEMTAPVINTFKTPAMLEKPGTKGEITMEFVYRSLSDGKSGADGRSVKVIDHPAQIFVCMGFQGGSLSDEEMRDCLAKLRNWLQSHKDEWIEDGPPRRLGYHGPMTPAAQRLWEVQVPVRSTKQRKST